MNYHDILLQHVTTGAEVTVATTPVRAELAGGFGIMEVGEDGRITRFVEKPTDPAVQAALPGYPDRLPASMGIYVFDRDVLADALAGSEVDFGKHVIPKLIETRRVYAFRHEGYWEDIGTIRAFYEANLDLCEPLPQFNFYDASAPIFTHARYLPATKIIKSHIERSVMADGCIINDADIEHSLVGVRSRIQAGATIRDSLVMGQDYYDSPERRRRSPAPPPWASATAPGSSGPSWTRTPASATTSGSRPTGSRRFFDGANFYIRDGIVIIPKNAVIMSGTVI